MGARQFLYDPEGESASNLEVGKPYVEAATKTRGQCLLVVGTSEVPVHLQDLVVWREKPEPQLKTAAFHVAHEARMFRIALSRTSDPFAYTSWFVHLRNLWSCLKGKGHDSDEIYAHDFFTDPIEWHRLRRSVPIPDTLRLHARAADELACHLSYNRKKNIYQGVTPNAEVTEFVARLYDMLTSSLPDDRRIWFGPAG